MDNRTKVFTSGNPMDFEVKGTNISLRNEDAIIVHVRRS